MAELIDTAEVIVCCGSGGVGKTTTAAIIGLSAARRGRRAVVVTIDPARRLADALGLDHIGATASLIDGEWPGELSALMLDAESTFDLLVERYAASDAQALSILSNSFYRNISGTLSGTQEYMASEKLYELHQNEAYDLVVVDTPPTRNALDFLEAPERLSRFLNHRIYRAVTAPSRGVLRVFNAATSAALRQVGKVVGSQVISDAVAFFQAFEGMEEGFRQRATSVTELFADEVTAFVLVTAPREDSVAEASFFAQRLAEDDIDVRALIVNRMHPPFGEADPAADEKATVSCEGHRAAPRWPTTTVPEPICGAWRPRNWPTWPSSPPRCRRPSSSTCRRSPPTCTTWPALTAWASHCSTPTQPERRRRGRRTFWSAWR